MSTMQPISTLISSFSRFMASRPPAVEPAFQRRPSPSDFSALNQGFASAFAPLFGAPGFQGATFDFLGTSSQGFFSPFAAGGAFGGSGIGSMPFGVNAFAPAPFPAFPMMNVLFPFSGSAFGGSSVQPASPQNSGLNAITTTPAGNFFSPFASGGAFGGSGVGTFAFGANASIMPARNLFPTGAVNPFGLF